MLPFSATDVLQGLGGSAGLTFAVSYDAPIAGGDDFGNLQGSMPTGAAADIWPALGRGGVLKVLLFSTAAAGVTFTLYLNSVGISTGLIPAGGSAIFDGNDLRIYDANGIRQ